MKSVKEHSVASPARDAAVSPHAADLMGWLLKHVSRSIVSDKRWGGLRASHHRLLSVVPREGIRITELGERLGMTTQASGQFVRYLVEQGHLRVEMDSTDRRSRVALRTALGDRAVAEITVLIQRIEDDWAEQVGARRYAAFRTVLSELAGGPGATPDGRA